MKIVTRDEMCKLPNGTVFAPYEPCVIGEIRVKTGYYVWDGRETWNGELHITPSFDMESDATDRITHFMVDDGSEADYYPDELFAVFDSNEIGQMIDIFTWAKSGCETDIDLGKYFINGEVLREKDLNGREIMGIHFG